MAVDTRRASGVVGFFLSDDREREQMNPSNEEIADCVDGMADQLLVNGRSRDKYRGVDGSLCLIASSCKAAQKLRPGSGVFDLLELSRAATNAVENRLPASVFNIVAFNFDASDDEVFDLLANTSKQLREEGAA